jgi:DNA-binding CsgD family transcriptional regulator
VSAGDAADTLHREAIERLGSTSMGVDLARATLLYGEWLQREGRGVHARNLLRAAYESLAGMGVATFADRARRELLAGGEPIRNRPAAATQELTAQEAHIARLARDGLSNPEIGAELFISARTVEWHLRKVFTKLGIGSRRDLRRVLPEQRRQTTGL